MDLIESDEEELPTTLDSTVPIDADDLTASTVRSSTLTDRTLLQVDPPSPRTARKRRNDEIYQRSQIPTASTTPLKTPPKRMSQIEQSGIGGPPLRSHPTAVEPQKHTQRWPEQVEQSKTFEQDIQAYQQQLEDEFKQFETSLAARDKKQPLEHLDWEDLEQKYRAEIGPGEADEQAIIEELQSRFQQFFLWMQATKERESDRATKRLRTRMAYVQNSEQQLLQKQEHFSKVLEAFHNAMSLLSHG